MSSGNTSVPILPRHCGPRGGDEAGRHARNVGPRESTCIRAKFESGGWRGQHRHLDNRGSPPTVDRRADGGRACRRGAAHRRRRLGASGPTVAGIDDGPAALRNGRVDTRPNCGPARYRRGRAGRRHRLEDNVRQRRGVPPARGQQRTGQAGGGHRSDIACARGVQVHGSDTDARHGRRSDRGGVGATRGA